MAVSGVLKLLLALLLPSTFLTVLCIAGAVLFYLGRHGQRVRRFGGALLGAGVAGLVAALLLPVDLWLLRPLESQFPRMPAPPHIDGVVVLGGAISAAISADRATPSLNRDADRLTAFATLARTYPQAKLVFAGGPPASTPDSLTEAEASRTVLEGFGVAPGRVLYDDQSRTTWENAVNAFSLGQPKPGETWLLVTSASHMPRAIGAFRRAGWPMMLAWPVAYRTIKAGWPAPLQPVGTRLTAVDLAAHEWVGLAAYSLRGRTDRLLPAPETIQQP